ncbi:unnamed protein product [Enterobius vermicularis]|uniref:Cadherin domain-containing protein n=1 Tax=Enterobius vermicularis TaxID=51028 RepID=A0A0N4VMF6_ENTVE|nr:unnamed protein product [Enterobius vermicularis]
MITYQRANSLCIQTHNKNDEHSLGAQLFAVDQQTGDILIDPSLADFDAGIFKIYIDEFKQQSTKPKATKIVQAQILSKNYSKHQHLKAALAANEQKSNMSVYFASPDYYRTYDATHRNRSSVCFHATENGQLIDSQKALHALTATVDADIALTKLYQAFKVTNVEPCFQTDRRITSRIFMSRTTIFWMAVSFVGMLILFCFCMYTCFIVRYKDYIDEKKAEMFDDREDTFPQPPKETTTISFINISQLPTIQY